MTFRLQLGIALAGVTVAIGCAWPNNARGQTPLVKQVTCPATVTVGAIGNLERWTAPGQQAPYAKVVLSKRTISGRPSVVAVCSYSAYGGNVTIERVMGPAESLHDCQTVQEQKGKGTPGEIRCR
jgi:hypothetical protein